MGPAVADPARSARPVPRAAASPTTASTWSSRWSPSDRWPARRDSPPTPSSASRPRPSISSSSRSTTRAGSTAGRSIPIITTFDPTNETEMRALCKTWTEGSPAAFAVLDGLGDWTGRRPALHHPGGPHALHRPVDHGDQLDQPGLALPVVDRPRPGGHPPGRGELGAERQPARGDDQGGGHRRRPGLGPAGPQRLPPARPAPGRRHPGGQDHRRRPQRHGHHRRRGPPGHPAAPECRRHLGHPADPLQRLLPGAPGRDRPAVLPQAAPERLRGRASPPPSGCCRSPTPRPSTARRA